MNETLKHFVQYEIGRGAKWREMGTIANTSHSSLIRWAETGTLTADTVIALCRHYEYPIGKALVRTGHLTEQEAAAFNGPESIRHVTDNMLVEEILRRIKEGSATEALTEPVDVGSGGDNVHELRPVDHLEDAGDIEFPGEHRAAADQGTHKADQQPHAD